MTETRIFFATDIHGSDKCFLKFLNAGKFYKAQVVILGGDLTGKMAVPIIENPNGSFQTTFLGETVTKPKGELKEFEKIVSNSGSYPYNTTDAEFGKITSDSHALDSLINRLAVERLRGWMELAESKLKDGVAKYYVTAGNDDSFEIDSVLRSSRVLTYVEGQVVTIDGQHEMICTGYANVTPWNCPRDIPDEQLWTKIEAMAQQANNPRKCIFTIHPPPYASTLDTAMELDKDLRPVVKDGSASRIPVGSKAVRRAIEEYKPLLGLHGHIHESRGAMSIGRTLCINPGSEFSEGILRGALIDIEDGKIKRHLLTTG
jgi:Icc-related predicted phosphoesterase